MSNTYANRTVAAGELILLNAGEYEEVYVAGLFRARAELDFNGLTERYVATIDVGRAEFDPPELPAVAFGTDPRSRDPIERGFIAWLQEQGLVERIPTVDVRLTGGFSLDDKPNACAQVDDAPLEAELARGYGR